MMNNILIIVAMNDEAKALINDLSLIKKEPFLIYGGTILNKNITLIISKVGKANAAAATSYGLANYKDIDIIINFGITGGYLVNLNSLYLVDKALYNDVDVTYFNYELGQIPGFPKEYHSFSLKGLNLPKIALYTKDTFETKVTHNIPCLVDMEGAAIYQIAYLFKVPVLSFKLVSDLIGDTNQKNDYKDSSIKMDIILKEKLYEILEVL